jgi:uncharacterized cupin superfamily protein
MEIFNLGRAEPAYDETDPQGYRSAMDRFGARIGASKIGGSLYELPEGQSICPYHYEYPEEEWLLVLSGAPTVRHPGGEAMLAPGDVVCFPPGPEGAHKVTNEGSEVSRVLMISTLSDPNVAVYPDSDKIGVFAGGDRDRVMVRRSSDVPYFDGEA